MDDFLWQLNPAEKLYFSNSLARATRVRLLEINRPFVENRRVCSLNNALFLPGFAIARVRSISFRQRRKQAKE